MYAAEMLPKFADEIARAKNKSFVPHSHMEYEGVRLKASVALRNESDIIFHLFMPAFPKDFPQLLADTVEAHFGSVERFKVDHVPEMNSYALLGEGLLKAPTADIEFLTEKFLDLLDNVLVELKGAK
jgi:hypothetical protein